MGAWLQSQNDPNRDALAEKVEKMGAAASFGQLASKSKPKLADKKQNSARRINSSSAQVGAETKQIPTKKGI